MPSLSALDAISPAFSRTKLVLFSPFRKGRTWKLAATAYLAIIGTVFLPYFLIAFFFIPMTRQAGGSMAVTILLSTSALFTLIYLLIFYLCTRLRFAFFDIVLNRGEFVAPAWRKYGPQSMRWTLFKIVLGTVFMAVIAVPTAVYIRQMIAAFSSLHLAPGQQPPPAFIAAIFSGYAVIFLLYAILGLFFWLSSLLSDFIVPSLALENTTLAEAFRRFGQLIRREPGPFALYALLKLGLALAGYMAQSLAFYAVFLIVGIVGGLLFLLGYGLHLLGVPILILTILGVILAIAFYLFLFLYVMFFLIGTVMTFLEAYALYFLAGRYPLLAQLLAESTPPAPVPPPSWNPAFATPPQPPPI
jgi:hypothetical protein